MISSKILTGLVVVGALVYSFVELAGNTEFAKNAICTISRSCGQN